MKQFIAISVALALAGCAGMQQAGDWLASDRARKAAANLKTIVAALDCGLVVSGAAMSMEIARIVDAGKAAVDRTGKVYAVSAAACESLGGTSASAR